MNAYSIVSQFENEVAGFAGSRFGVAVNSCTNALFLCCKYLKVKEVILPARTYISVPMSAIHAGGTVVFNDYDWAGTYRLNPYTIVDGAKRFKRGMYEGGFHCLSFHISKHINIGMGGMILTNNYKFVEWAKRVRHDGRTDGMSIHDDRVSLLGYPMHMTPEEAARGLELLMHAGDGFDDLPNNYADLSDKAKYPVFHED